jgi:hypothetical protein
MPKVDSESGEPMSDAPDASEDEAGGASIDAREQGDPGEDSAGSPS